MRRVPSSATRRFSMVMPRALPSNTTSLGRFSIGTSASSRSVPCACSVGLPHVSSAFMPRIKGSFGRLRLAVTARHRTAGPETMGTHSVPFSKGAKFPVACTSAIIRYSRPACAKVCINIPGDPCARSPSVTMILSPGRRYPPTCRMVRISPHGRCPPFFSYARTKRPSPVLRAVT